MKDFVALYKQLDETTSSNEKINLLKNYFLSANEKDAVWCIALFIGKRFKKPITTTQLKTWVAEKSNLPYWLVDECHHIAGDLGETVAILASNNNFETKIEKKLHEVIDDIQALKNKSEDEKKEIIFKYWNNLSKDEIFIFNKLISGAFRVGVSEKNIIKALSLAYHIAEDEIAHKLMGNWEAENTMLQDLIFSNQDENFSKPYPFYLSYALDDELENLGSCNDWQAEYKWDGIRGQIIIRNNEIYVWSRGEELVTHQYPEFEKIKETIPNGTVLDGEIIAYKNNQILNFQDLQKRIGRKNVGKKMLEEIPVSFMAYDILEFNGSDIRHLPLHERRNILENLIRNNPHILLSEIIEFNNWEDLKSIQQEARNKNAEGLMLKNKNSTYQVGRKKGDWWKWKVNPFTIDAVLTFAMQGHGRRANLFTDYTFALWHQGELVTFTKAYSGLSDEEIKEVDAFVRKNTLEKFGPVRSVKPELVFEIAFEGIAYSKRHKSGVALRFPRIARWRKDKKTEEANSLDDLKKLIL
ncbi:MAG: ATP-dependent DNA ligase [Bacteroidia bacterium]